MTTVMPGLLPDSQGVQFTARPALRTRESLASSHGHNRNGFLHSTGSAGSFLDPPGSAVSPNAKLSSIEIEALLREKVRAKFEGLQQAFQTYDVDEALSVTKGEFRRVLESFCMPLTTEQFETVLAKIDQNSNGTVKYCDFLEKFNGRRESSALSWTSRKDRFNPQQSTELNMDMVEKMLRQKISKNLKQVVKAFRLFDYNRDGKIQRHELRRVLENFCFKFTDAQFEKVWQRCDYHHVGVIEYMNFLTRLGVIVDKEQAPTGKHKNFMSWPHGEDKHTDELKRRMILQSNLVNKGLNFDQIEYEFRKMMKKNYIGVKKACMARDFHLDGWMKIEDLKAILDQFIMPMSDQLFVQLMDRFQIKASGKVKWEFFLTKFQSAQSVGNGQTIPIKPSHKWFPLRGGDEGLPTGEAWARLYKHVNDHHSSIKEAFLQYDKNRNGFVSRKELRVIFEKFNFRLSDEQFKKIMSYIDPGQTNKISYHSFLELFEEKETLAGHKWLNSCHRVNETVKPTVIAWNTVEDVLRQKIMEYWKPFSDNIAKHDPYAERFITPQHLKQTLDRHILPVSDDHFEHMMSRVSSRQDGKINYLEFLEMLDVTVTPGDVIGVSSQITDNSQHTMRQMKEDQLERHGRMDKRSQNKTGFMSCDEVIVRLKDRMSQHNVNIRKSFLTYARSNATKISKKHFREMLASFGMFMTDDQFKQLTSKLNFQNNFMNYNDFVTSFEDATRSTQDVTRPNNHHVNPIRGDEYGMTALEAESKLRSKLRENFADLRAAFYKFDDDHNGLLTKDNFRRLLDTFMIVVGDEEFEKLCNRLGLDKRCRVSYHDFLDKFEIRDTVDGHKWWNSVHRFNERKPMKMMTAEEAHEMLKDKSHRQWQDLAKAFLSINRDLNGVIRKNDLRHVLSSFMLPITKEEFIRLWNMYDEDKKGYISYQDFMEKIGASEYAPGDQFGVSREIINQSNCTLNDHLKEQQAKQERITLNQAVHSSSMTAQFVHRQLKDKIRDHYPHFYSAFRKYDTRKRGHLSVQDVQQALVDLNYFINDAEFFKLLDLLGLSTKSSKLDYSDFLKAFEDGRISAYGNREADVRLIEYENLTPDEAEHKLREKVGTDFGMIKKAMTAFDKHQTGKIPLADFRRLLDLFCFKMTDSQFKYLLNRLYMGPDNFVNYRNFLDNYRLNEQEDSEKWLMSIQEENPVQDLQQMTTREVREQLHENVTAHFYSLAKEFADIDYAKIGVISKEDFREVLDKHVFRLSDIQFDDLWSLLPINEFGNLHYREFLKEYSSEGPESDPPVPPVSQSAPPKTALPYRRPHSVLSRSQSFTQGIMPRPSTMMSRSSSRLATPLVNAASVEHQLKQKICKHWQSIQRLCREKDGDNTGTISVYDFRDVLKSHNVDISGDDFHKLAIKYDLQETGRFSYVEFLRHFVLTLKSQEDNGKLNRMKVPPAMLAIHREEGGQPLVDAMRRLHSCVVKHWKEMRRAFRKIDDAGCGNVNPLEFRRVLKQFSIDLSEEEFYQLLSHYDKSMDGNVSYNDFIKAYLQQ